MKLGILRLLFLVALALFFSCKKDNTQDLVLKHKLSFRINYSVDDVPLLPDTIKYSNAAGNNYSVSRLEYFISSIKLHKAGGNVENDKVFYINFKKETTNSFYLENIPEGDYSGISLIIGLDSIHNQSNALAHTQENNGMSWPDIMGGGYHFMKLEGHYRDVDPNEPINGYAIHLGKNKNAVKLNKQFNFSLKSDKTLNLTMNINEWYKNSENYDFNVDGNYSMNDANAMAKLAANGTDVFKFSFE